MSRSVSSSPLRKKSRLSSPTYDAQFADFDPGDFQVLDDIETRHSQDIHSTPSSSYDKKGGFDRKEKRRRAIEDALRQAREFGDHEDSGIILVDANNPCLHGPGPSNETRQSLPRSLGFTSAASLPLGPVSDDVSGASAASTSAVDFTPETFLKTPSVTFMHTCRPRSPENKPRQDCETSPTASEAPLPISFLSASTLHHPAVEKTEDAAVSNVAPTMGFKRASGATWASPSVAAFEMAKKKLQVWEAEIESELLTSGEGEYLPKEKKRQAERKPLEGVENSVVSAAITGSIPASVDHEIHPARPQSFKHSSFTTPSRNHAAVHASRSLISNPVLARSSAAVSLTLQSSTSASSSSSAPSTPFCPAKDDSRFLAPTPRHSTPATFTAPKASASLPLPVTTPQKMKPLGLTPRSHAFSSSKTRPKFVTPFKQGMKLGEPGRNSSLAAPQPQTQVHRLHEEKGKEREVTPTSAATANKENAKKRVLDLAKSSNHKTLADCGLTPQPYTNEELTEMGFDPGLFSLTTITHYLYYRFNLDIPSTSSLSTQMSLGPDSALDTLRRMGCSLATKAWVDNHWSLILWKMIGMLSLNPATLKEKWCWNEVVRQLQYRYVRELANGSRPALRLITTQDAPVSCPLVLCVSDIFWTDEYVDAEGRPVVAHPELELTDGWYRLRATVDEALARAARRKILRVGRKIACSGARLESNKKDPMEVLEAYGSAHLAISGNSTHLAPWHAKLGFQMTPFVATLGSLSSDGGSVALMDLIITQIFPVGFIEFITRGDGELVREGPRTEKDEALEEDRWRECRSQEAAKLRDELEKKLHRLESYADRLERIAGGEFHPAEEESEPDHLENIAEELEDSEDPASFIKGVNKKDAGWLSLFLRRKCVTDREKGGDEIDRELATNFPPRQVRNFRVLRVKDAQAVRKPSYRTAQLTVWDAMSLNAAEGDCTGFFAVGRRYMVTSLVPSQASAWMGLEPGSEVYLSTRRDSRWKVVH